MYRYASEQQGSHSAKFIAWQIQKDQTSRFLSSFFSSKQSWGKGWQEYLDTFAFNDQYSGWDVRKECISIKRMCESSALEKSRGTFCELLSECLIHIQKIVATCLHVLFRMIVMIEGSSTPPKSMFEPIRLGCLQLRFALEAPENTLRWFGAFAIEWSNNSVYVSWITSFLLLRLAKYHLEGHSKCIQMYARINHQTTDVNTADIGRNVPDFKNSFANRVAFSLGWFWPNVQGALWMELLHPHCEPLIYIKFRESQHVPYRAVFLLT